MLNEEKYRPIVSRVKQLAFYKNLLQYHSLVFPEFSSQLFKKLTKHVCSDHGIERLTKGHKPTSRI